MSRGPGLLQIQIMHTLKKYHELGTLLGWEWRQGGSWMRKYADKNSIACYEAGCFVPVWMLLRDLAVHKPLLSRALHGLDRMGHVCLLEASLQSIHNQLRTGQNAKFTYLTQQGYDWLSDNKVKVTKLSLIATEHTP